MGNKKTKDGKGKGDGGKTGNGQATTTTSTPTNQAPKEVKSYKVLLIGDRYSFFTILVLSLNIEQQFLT